MNDLSNNRIVNTFGQLRAEGKKTLAPFLTAGYPDLDTTKTLLQDFESRGVKVCELGIPFSDPIADGPVIQASFTEALNAGVNLDGIFEMVRQYRADGGEMSLLAMVTYSIVYRRGVEEFFRKASEAGFDGTIIPDLPLEEAANVEALATANGMANVMLIAPTTPAERQAKIAEHSRGFIYYISVAGTTGERDKLPDETIEAVAQLRERTETPICVGFGISNPQTVQTVCQVADGAIVGSAIVHRVTNAKDKSCQEMVNQVGQFVSELIAPVA